MTDKPNRLNFRAWHPDEEAMFYSFDPETAAGDCEFKTTREGMVKFYFPGMLKMHGMQPDSMASLETDYPVMQSTGLADKNGKEMFTGDIVKSTTEFNSYTGMDCELYGGNVYEVAWRNRGFVLKPDSIYIPNWDNLEIIGNVHEDPDLLLKKEK